MEIERYKRLIEKEFNKMVCNKTISNFRLDFDKDVDENGILTVDAQVRLKEPVRYYTIKESDFPELTHEEFIELCDKIIELCNKIKEEINNDIQNELEKDYEKEETI